MRVFLTGGTGFVGPAVVRELRRAGHQVLGLARSPAAADALTALGADVHRGSLTDLDTLRTGARRADGVVHLALTHGERTLSEALEIDRRALATFGDVLTGSGAPLVFASATSFIAPGRTITEHDAGDPDSAVPRARTESEALRWAGRGVRVVAVRLPTVVHGPDDVRGFIPMLVDVARTRGFSAHVGTGGNRWPAVHQLDAAVLFRRALEGAAAGTRVHAVAEEGIAFRDIARAIGTGLGVATTGIDPDRVDRHFSLRAGPLAVLAVADVAASSRATREALHWRPVRPGLLDDLAGGGYFRRRPGDGAVA